jgi:hypothetical protein
MAADEAGKNPVQVALNQRKWKPGRPEKADHRKTQLNRKKRRSNPGRVVEAAANNSAVCTISAGTQPSINYRVKVITSLRIS